MCAAIIILLSDLFMAISDESQDRANNLHCKNALKKIRQHSAKHLLHTSYKSMYWSSIHMQLYINANTHLVYTIRYIQNIHLYKAEYNSAYIIFAHWNFWKLHNPNKVENRDRSHYSGMLDWLRCECYFCGIYTHVLKQEVINENKE